MFLSRVPNHDHDHNHILSTGKSHTSSRNTDSHAGGRSNDGQDSNTPDKVSITNGTRRVSSRTSVSHPHHHHRRGTNGRREWNGGGGGSGYHHPPSSSPLCNTLSAATAVTSHPPVEQIEFHLKNRYGIHSNHQRGVNGLDDEELGMVESIADTIECWEGSEVEMETIDLEIALLTERQTGIRDLHGSMRQLHDIQKGKKRKETPLLFFLLTITEGSFVHALSLLIAWFSSAFIPFLFVYFSKDLATIVMEQDETLEQFQTHALETLDHSTGALAQLLALQQRVQYNSLYQERRRTTFLLMAALVLVAVMGTRWIWKTFYPATEDGVPEH